MHKNIARLSGAILGRLLLVFGLLMGCYTRLHAGCGGPVSFYGQSASGVSDTLHLFPSYNTPPLHYYSSYTEKLIGDLHIDPDWFIGGANFNWEYVSAITNNSVSEAGYSAHGSSKAKYFDSNGQPVYVEGQSDNGTNDGWAAELGTTNWYAAELGASATMVSFSETPQQTTTTISETEYSLVSTLNTTNGNSYSGTVTHDWVLSGQYAISNLIDNALGKVTNSSYSGNWTSSQGVGASAVLNVATNGSIENPQLVAVSATATKSKYRLVVPTKSNMWYEVTFVHSISSTDVYGHTSSSTNETKYKFLGTGGTNVFEGEFNPERISLPTKSQTESLALPKVREISPTDCKSCSAGGEIPGNGHMFLMSVGFELYLGKTLHGQLAGILRLHQEDYGTNLSDAATLVLDAIPDAVQATYDGSGRLQRIESPQLLTLIEQNTNFSYQISCYPADETGYLTNGSPVSQWTVYDPDNGTNFGKRLNIIETRNASSITNQFEWSTAGTNWTFISGNGLKKERKTSVWDEASQRRVDIMEILDPQTDALLSRIEEKHGNFNGIDQLTEEVIGVGADSRTNSYDYNAQGLLKSVRRWDGYWENCYYDTSSRLTQVISAYRDQSPTETASLARERVISYSSVDISQDDDAFMPTLPREEIVKVLGHEVSRTYWIRSEFMEKEIRCVTPGAAWDATDNLVTVTTNYADGDFKGYVQAVIRPDNTMTLFEYEYDASTNKVTTVYVGAPNASYSAVTNGVKTVTIESALGQVLSKTTVDILSNIIITQETYSDFDSSGRPHTVTYLNGTRRAYDYSCCNLESETDETGMTTSYGYDALKRRVSTTRAGVIMINVYDAADRVVSTIRQGTNGTQMVMTTNVFDTAGQMISSKNALGYETVYSTSVDGNGIRTETMTYPDLTTSIHSYYCDGSQKSVEGTANHGVRYDYGVETDGGVYREFSKKIMLLTNGADSSEWVKTYTDAVGNSYKTVYPDNAVEISYFNSKGQLWKQVDADGVVTLFQYNAKGEREYTAVDMDRDDVIDFDGTDRISRTLNYATNAHGVDVLRSERWQWQSLNTDMATLISTSDRSVETKESWRFAFGLTNYFVQVCNTNTVLCTLTNVAPDGSFTVSVSQFGLSLSSTRYDSNGVQLAQQSMGYDEFNRTITMTDARTGTITNTLDALGRTLTRTTPAPAPGQNPQTTQTDYDNMGRVWRVIEPDGGVEVSTYHPTGELKRKVGNRTYPVDYTYDYAGRMKTLKTWQDFDNDSVAAITTWNYDSQRGFMTSKRYADNKGPDYEYTLTGKLAKRTWARGIETDYAYNDSGDLATVDYSDSTPDVTYAYDRLGRKATVAQGTQDAVTFYYTAAGQLAAEQHTSGLLSGITVTNAYDGLLRRTHLTVLTNGGSVYQALYGYDAASRMLTVSDGTNNATYSYVTDSSLVGGIEFKQNSTLRITTTKQYDLLNRLTNISSITASFTNSFAYLYNDANQRTKVTREDGSCWNYGYDDLGQVTSGKRYWADNTPVAGKQYDYDFDDIGNRKSTTQNAKSETRKSLYTANLLNQYTSRTVPGYADVLGTAHSNATVTVNYERAARKGEYWHKELGLNNQGQAVYAGVTNVAVLNDGANPDIVTTNTGKLFLPQTPEQFTYDDDGNLTGDGRWTYAWDGENRLIQMETKTGAVSAGTPKQKLEFAYDDQWRRIQKKVSVWNGTSYTASYTNRFVYDGWNLVATLNPTTLYQSFMWGIDLSDSMQAAGGVGGLVAMADVTSSTSHFAAYDGNGNLVSLVNAQDASRSAGYEYGPYGEMIEKVGVMAAVNPFRFSTKYQDQETTLLCYGYRYFNTIQGFWISSDVIQEKGGPNLYSNSGNNLINKIDYLGLICCGPAEIAKGKEKLIKRYEFAKGYMEGRGIPHGGSESCSCNVVNLAILNYLAKWTSSNGEESCWSCKLERRSRFIPVWVPIFANSWYDHWAVVCLSADKQQRILFDYWGNRPAAEDPSVWFYSKYDAFGAEAFPDSALYEMYPTTDGRPDLDDVEPPPPPPEIYQAP